MIKTKQDLYFYIQEDRKRNGQDRGVLRYWFDLLRGNEQAHAFRYLKVLRHQEFHMNNKGIFHKIAAFYYGIRRGRLGLRYSIEIHPNTCGYGLRIMHLSAGVLLNVRKIGNYCGVNAGVLIGNNRGNENRPVIGDYVAFGPGSKAFGKIKIGNHVFVAPNAVVVKDVPDSVIVGGIPAKVLKMNN